MRALADSFDLPRLLQGGQNIESSSRVRGIRREDLPVIFCESTERGEGSQATVMIPRRFDVHDENVGTERVLVESEQPRSHLVSLVLAEALRVDLSLWAVREPHDEQVARGVHCTSGSSSDPFEHTVDAVGHE